MAWRPSANVINGQLDNRTPGRIQGWICFHRRGKLPLRVVLSFVGDFHDDIRGKVIRLRNPSPVDRNELLGRDGTYMEGFAPIQKGEAGDITAGVPLGLKDDGTHSFAYTPYPYLEWFAANGRVVLELDAAEVEIVDGDKVLKVPRNACEYQTEEDMIQKLGPLLVRSIHLPPDEPDHF